MTVQEFKNGQNLTMLWDVVLDELSSLSKHSIGVNNIKTIFEANIGPFLSNINPNTSLMTLNKKFLSQVVLAVNRLTPSDQNIKRITITNEEVNEPYKIEDIQAGRISNFEKEVEEKKTELEKYMNLSKPQNGPCKNVSHEAIEIT